MLYDGAIRFVCSKKKIDEKDYAGKGTYIGKVQAIVSELMSSLDFSMAPGFASASSSFISTYERLTEANLELKTNPLTKSSVC